MAVKTYNFTTGPTTLPDVGTLSYNGCVFSPLFTSDISGNVVKDEAHRTTKLMEYTIKVDGFVTLAQGLPNISPTIVNLQKLLTACAGTLIYRGRGFDLLVDANGATTFGLAARDVAWGPVPELIEFQPLGGGLSAKVVWKVVTRVVWYPNPTPANIKGGGGGSGGSGLLQFNCETEVNWNEDYFSSMSVRGTMEIPLTRPAQGTRTLTSTVDDARNQLDDRIFSGIDLSRFRVTKRNYNISRDKRVMVFDVAVEEKPYMDLPPGCPIARGRFSCKPNNAGMMQWTCSLSATYIERADSPLRLAYFAFLTLLRLRINWSVWGYIPGLAKRQNIPISQAKAAVSAALTRNLGSAIVPPNSSLSTIWGSLLGQQSGIISKSGSPTKFAQLRDFSFEEGLYLDSKSISFSAVWWLTSSFDSVMMANGAWRKVPEKDTAGGNLWATSMANVSGSQSWLSNKLDPKRDIIVDFGGG